MSGTFDALVVGDARFAGGSTAALVADVTAMAALGMKLGLIFVRSAYLADSRDPPNPAALALADLEGVTRLSPAAGARAELAFLHHPLVFSYGIEERPRLAADRTIIVAHHAPFRADGSLVWDPIATRWRTRRLTGLSPWFAPVSATVRSQLASFAPMVRQTSADWPNIFDPSDWPDTRPIMSEAVLTIGRHGRPDPLKFPATGPEIDAALPAGPGVRVRVLGCPSEALAAKGGHPERWEVLAFGAEPASAFLNSLDVFVYHYHQGLTEAFGRTVAEAALTGRLCLLDPRLEATFGDLALYCGPAEVAAVLDRLRADPASARAKAGAGAAIARRRYGTGSIAARLEELRRDVGSTGRGEASAPPVRAMRKLVGHYRRRARGQAG